VRFCDVGLGVVLLGEEIIFKFGTVWWGGILFGGVVHGAVRKSYSIR